MASLLVSQDLQVFGKSRRRRDLCQFSVRFVNKTQLGKKTAPHKCISHKIAYNSDVIISIGAVFDFSAVDLCSLKLGG